MIPKLIHQIWFQGKENIPEHLKTYHDTWIQNNPNFVIIVWDEVKIQKEIDVFFDKDVRDMYNNYDHMIQKIDLAKYIILYKYGGVYIDMDTKNIQRIKDSFFEDYDIIVSKLPENAMFKSMMVLGGNNITNDIINNGIIMAAPSQPLLLDTINEAKKNKNSIYKYINKTLYVYVTTGPLCLTNAVIKNQKNPTYSKIKIIDQSYFEGCDLITVESGSCKPPENAIGVHLYENAWISDSDNFIKKLLIYLFNNFVFILSIIVLFFAITYLVRSKIIKKLTSYIKLYR